MNQCVHYSQTVVVWWTDDLIAYQTYRQDSSAMVDLPSDSSGILDR
jgi:hypothetical protein